MNLMLPSKQALQQFEKKVNAEGHQWQEGLDEFKIEELDQLAQKSKAPGKDGFEAPMHVRLSWDKTDIEKKLTIAAGKFVGDHNTHVAPILDGLVDAPNPRELESKWRTLSEGIDRATNQLIEGGQIDRERNVAPTLSFFADSREVLQKKRAEIEEKIAEKEKEYQKRLRAKAAARGRNVSEETMEMNAKQTPELNRLLIKKQGLVGTCGALEDVLKSAADCGIFEPSLEANDGVPAILQPEVAALAETSAEQQDIEREGETTGSAENRSQTDAKLDGLHLFVSTAGLLGQIFFKKRVAAGKLLKFVRSLSTIRSP
jgi:hypothetical protein